MLEKLKEYKETITIIIFFLGGFLWISQKFPDRTYLDERLKATGAQIAQLNCLLNNNISATDSQLQIKIHMDNIDHFRTRIAFLKRKPSLELTDDEHNEMDDFIREIENERDALQKERARSDQILKILKSGCANV
jgi:uncharacterized protein YdcH (DUF465 family)